MAHDTFVQTMDAMRNVLIPTDFSENSLNAIRYALAYYADIPVNFYLLHVIGNTQSQKNQEEKLDFEKSIYIGDPIGDPATCMEAQIEICNLLCNSPSHTFYPLLVEGRLVETIRYYIADKLINCIVMGTKGTSEMLQHDIGSNTCEVITKVKCPILVIPEHAKFKGIKNTAFLTDYNCLYRHKVISTLSETLELQKAALRILHSRSLNASLTPAQVDNKGFLHYFFRDTKHSFHFVENKNMDTGLQDFVDTWDINLLAIVAKNLNFIQKLLLRPASKITHYQTELPFLVIHE